MYKKITALSLLLVFLLTAGFGCKATDSKTKAAMTPITLTYWRVFDDTDAFQEIIAKYRELHPYITIQYRKLRYEEYENELINALAEDRGPDIFSVHNTWMKEYETKIVPMPATITMAYPVITGKLKKEVTSELRTYNSPTLKQIRDSFVDAVSYDVISNDGQVYGLPLSVDTLAMFYNKDLFNNAGISQVPQYWNREFLQDVKKLTKQDPTKDLVQAGVGLGGSANISRFSDILSLLMMQNGAIMMDNGQVLFDKIPPASQSNNYNPGIEALRFYTDFANAGKESYSWNNTLPNSLDMFISGKLAMYFGYSYDLPTIKTQAPKLNFSVAKFPQIEGTPPTNINFANYWIEVVSKKSTHQDEAWDFIQFITKEEQAKIYLEKTKKPTALRSLVAAQRSDNEIGVFADEVLTAKSWYKGKNSPAAEDAIKEMIDTVINNPGARISDIIEEAASKVQQTIN